MNPFEIFTTWYNEEQQRSNVRIPSACCLSTIGLNGYPNARFVSLKEVKEETFIVTGPLHARKGVEINNTPKVALTCWWPATERQVRVQGDAIAISAADADKYFSERQKDAQIVSHVSEQGQPVESLFILQDKYEKAEKLFKDIDIERPENWGGYIIQPVRIELMAFKATRFHERMLFQKADGLWQKVLLQP